MVIRIRLGPILLTNPVFMAALPAVIAATLLLRLMTALLLGPSVQGGGQILEGTHEMDAKITFGFVGLLDRLGNTLNGTGELFKGVLEAFEGCCDAFEDFSLGVSFRGAHKSCVG